MVFARELPHVWQAELGEWLAGVWLKRDGQHLQPGAVLLQHSDVLRGRERETTAQQKEGNSEGLRSARWEKERKKWRERERKRDR